MRGFLFSAALIALIPFSAAAAEGEAAVKAGKPVKRNASEIISNGYAPGGNPDESRERLDSTVVVASRAGKSTPVTYTMVGKEQLRSGSPLNSLPMTLNLQPSVVAVNEGGTGIGYSKMTIRGSKGAQVNVTLNGITLNDAESQEVFWVNMPSIANVLSSVQLQRGLGTSANGPGAFGASVNMSTASVGSNPYVSFEVAAGSYNTFMATVAAGTGLTRSGIYFDAAYTRNYTDGYIRNAKAKVQSAYAALGWIKGNNSLKLTYIMGDQHTGITWNGIDLDIYYKDRRYNEAGEWYEYRCNPDGSYVLDGNGNRIVTSVHYYDNDTDNYTQHHLQLNYTRQFQNKVVWSTTAHLTKGDGYYENYKTGKKFTKYGFPSDFVFESDGLAYKASDKSDFIIRKSMDNCYVVLNSDVRYTGEKLHATGGVNMSCYSGNHFGEVLWNRILGDAYDYASRNHDDPTNGWYFNNGLKQEINLSARAEYSPLTWLTAYIDMQYRGVFLKMSGTDDDDRLPLDYGKNWSFVNPRAGLTFHWNSRHKAYASAAMGNREPGRSDIKEVISGNNLGGSIPELKPEKMADVEIGYEYSAKDIAASASFYFMEYFDMLLETGRLNDVGYTIRENVGRAYRRGLETAVAWHALPWLTVDANATLSLNKINNYVEYVSHVDEYWNMTGQTTALNYGQTNMLMSPSAVGMLQLVFAPFRSIACNSLKTTALTINGKYVGRQYLDNTSSAGRSIPGYFVSNLSLTHEFSLRYGKLGLGVYVNNLLNNMYYADGWCWKNILDSDGKMYDGIGIFTQAPVNFMFKASYRF